MDLYITYIYIYIYTYVSNHHNDVKKAYFYAPATRRVFVALPQEDKLAGKEDMCALLMRSLYGTRDAAYNWTQAYTTALCEKLGFEKVIATRLAI